MFQTVENTLHEKGCVDVRVMRDGECIGRIHAANGVIVASPVHGYPREVYSLTVAKYEFGDPNFIDWFIEQ